jgi:DNA-binding NarL/FixJ family response regulator
MIVPMAGSVLIVDDNPRFRARAKRWLEASGFAVIAEAADGRSALEAAREHRPAVVLLDVELPDMSGLSVAAWLASQAEPPAVVLTSTHDPTDYGNWAARCGARGFLPKAELSGEALTALLP